MMFEKFKLLCLLVENREYIVVVCVFSGVIVFEV